MASVRLLKFQKSLMRQMEIAEQHGSQKKQVVFVAVIVLLVGYVGIMQHLGQPGDLEVSALHVRQR